MEALGIPLSWQGLGISGIILFVILALVKGWIIPGSTVDRMLKEKDHIIDFQKEMIDGLTDTQQSTVKLLETLNSAAATRTGVDGT